MAQIKDAPDKTAPHNAAGGASVKAKLNEAGNGMTRRAVAAADIIAKRDVAIKADVLANLSSQEIVSKHALAPVHGAILDHLRATHVPASLVEPPPDLHKIADETGASPNTVRKWTRIFGFFTADDIEKDKRQRAETLLKSDHPNIRGTAADIGLNPATVMAMAKRLNIHGQGRTRARPENAKYAAIQKVISTEMAKADTRPFGIGEAPTVSLSAEDIMARVAAETGKTVGRTWAYKIRGEAVAEAQAPEKTLLDTAQHLVAGHLKLYADAKTREAIGKIAGEKSGWIAQLEGRYLWPNSYRNWQGLAVPENKYLDAALTYYLKQAGIKGPENLQQRAQQAYVSLVLPPDIFTALHCALVVRGVKFPRHHLRLAPQHAGQDASGPIDAPTRHDLQRRGETLKARGIGLGSP